MYRSPRDEFKELFAELDRAVASYPIGSHKAVDPLRKIVGACLRSEEPHDEWARAAHDAVTKIAENVVTLLGLGHAVAALGDICVRSGPGERHDPPG